MNLENLCSEVISLVKEVGKFISEERKKFSTDSIQTKGKHNFVTHVDTGAEKRLVDGLEKILPLAGFIAEEGTGSAKNGKYKWVIDPIDGTTNFIHGCPPYSISVALMEDEDIILGVVYEIFNSECFYSYKGSKAFLNGIPIQVSDTSSVSDSLIATGFPCTDFERMPVFMKSLEHFFTQTHGVRRLGSAAVDLAYVACGRYDAFYEYSLHAWDVAAGAFIVNQAGGKCADFKGGDDFIFGTDIVASNPLIFDEFQKTVGHFMNH
jgi:myo-inositol-1(or 4)-monophosphatase